MKLGSLLYCILNLAQFISLVNLGIICFLHLRTLFWYPNYPSIIYTRQISIYAPIIRRRKQSTVCILSLSKVSKLLLHRTIIVHLSLLSLLLIQRLSQICYFKRVSLKCFLVIRIVVFASEALQAHFPHYDLLSAALSPRFDYTLSTKSSHMTLGPIRSRLSIRLLHSRRCLMIDKKDLVSRAANYHRVLLLHL